MQRKKADSASNIDSVKHKDKRSNIPTEELRDFVKEDEKSPKVVHYRRDPSLDPQLVWKGKDEQDSKDLSVPCVPIYIQEKIHPQAIVEDIKAYAARQSPEEGPRLFSDFNGIGFEELIEFYRHEQNWSNRMILGDSLQVITSLAEKEGLKGKVQMIYLDPPYGIKFGSNWQVSTRKRDVKDGKAEDVTRQPEQVKAFRDTWELGIHSYLSYLRDRLMVARELLTETGSVFVQIGDENVHLVRCLMDEVFGSENFVSFITFRKKMMPLGAKLLESVSDYILWYSKDIKNVKYRSIFEDKNIEGDYIWGYIQFPDMSYRKMTLDEINNHKLLPDGYRIFQPISLRPAGFNKSGVFEFEFKGKKYKPIDGSSYGSSKDGMERLKVSDRLIEIGNSLRYKLFWDDYPVMVTTNLINKASPPSDKIYVVQTSITIIKRCLLMATDPGDIVLDPTCGSGTTAYVAEQWGRRWITIDTSRVALALARTRLMSARYPYYYLADTREGIDKEAEITGKPSLSVPMTEGDIKKGFVYRRVPHVTLKSIANNPDIKEGMSRQEIDAAIARHAEMEVLYDQPYEDKKRIRVAGPFTVESLSPHRILNTDDEAPTSETQGRKIDSNGQFVTLIIENLKKAGVQNTKISQRLIFDCLDPYAGIWIHASGKYTKNDKSMRVAVTIGPEHGTVGPELVKEAAKEAVQGVGFELLIVCGFAFDPHVSEEVKRYGNLTVLPAKMNPDLTIGDDLLKKTGTGNLFMVFGEPDMEIKTENEKVTVIIKGLDIYDPTTGEIRNNSTDDIACWFIDTNYNGESFFVRHAYFTGADRPYEKLKNALRTEIDETAWSSVYSTESRPFDKPETGKIAIKVINHYGDEVLKVYTLSS
ncbi:MAG: site-specific DNA-methyltransferase [Nitrospirae bacterium]|nr:site-specific DNA-methyltransferase [Nitrospirota bacterium]